MNAKDTPTRPGYPRGQVPLGHLLRRASTERASWLDLPDGPGVYVVYLSEGVAPRFRTHAGDAANAETTPPDVLKRKWQHIVARSSTDIVYIGRGDELRRRVRFLARFGVGKADNHHGGEWMWQIEQISDALVLYQGCASGEQVSLENAMLMRFQLEHGDYPLANRAGPRG